MTESREADVMDDGLRELVTRVDDMAAEQDGGVSFPPIAPTDGQTLDEWQSHVARLRVRHDAQALEAVRRIGTTPTSPLPHLAAVVYDDVPVDGGVITVRRYTPMGEGPKPAVLLFHGGGWWMGGAAAGFELNDRICRVLAARVGAVVINVDYRLAPEHRFPVQLEDGYAAVCWVAGRAAQLSVDEERIAVMGFSSGGNLAAALSRLCRDREGPRLRAQVLQVPALDAMVFDTSSEALVRSGGLRDNVDRVRSYYSHEVLDRTDPLLSVLHADDLEGLPEAVVVTGAHDPLRHGGAAYAGRLRAQGVPVTTFEYPMTHTVATLDVMERNHADLVAELRRIFATPDDR